MYGLDVDLANPLADRDDGRSWRWFLVRVHGLLADPRSRLFAALTPDPPTPPSGGTT